MKTPLVRLGQYLACGKEINTEIARKLFGIDHLQSCIEILRKAFTIKEFYRTSDGKKVRWYAMEAL